MYARIIFQKDISTKKILEKIIFQYLNISGTNEGNDLIIGFNASQDKIELLNGQYSDLTVTGSGSNTLITLVGGTTITLVNVNSSNIDETDFKFTPVL